MNSISSQSRSSLLPVERCRWAALTWLDWVRVKTQLDSGGSGGRGELRLYWDVWVMSVVTAVVEDSSVVSDVFRKSTPF